MRAKELLFTAERLDAARAPGDRPRAEVLPADQLLAHCKARGGQDRRRRPARGRPGQARDGGRAWTRTCARANELERQAFGVLFGSADQKEGMKAFLEKRPAGFTGK